MTAAEFAHALQTCGERLPAVASIGEYLVMFEWLESEITAAFAGHDPEVVALAESVRVTIAQNNAALRAIEAEHAAPRAAAAPVVAAAAARPAAPAPAPAPVVVEAPQLGRIVAALEQIVAKLEEARTAQPLWSAAPAALDAKLDGFVEFTRDADGRTTGAILRRVPGLD